METRSLDARRLSRDLIGQIIANIKPSSAINFRILIVLGTVFSILGFAVGNVVFYISELGICFYGLFVFTMKTYVFFLCVGNSQFKFSGT